MTGLSRRRFLQITGAGMAAAASSLRSGVGAATRARPGGLRTVPTFCDICFWKCNAIATGS